MDKMYKRGYYTGTFDLLHSGHLAGLKRASEMCDQLFVGVATDDVVFNYKHKKPAIPFEERIKIVGSIKGVYKAIPQFDLYNKLEICKAIGADVLFSSDEYLRESYEEGHVFTQKELDGIERWEKFSEEANANGIDVVYFQRNEGISSTQIKESILASSGYQKASDQMIYSEGENVDEDNVCQ